jgi:hypothetical protein
MRRTAALLLPLVLAGCAMTTRAIREDYLDFNQTLQYNQNQQMLLNLVRMRYRESPLFLKVGALSSSYDFEMSAQANVGRSTGNKSYGLGVNSTYSVRPTITYTPIEGNTYVRQVLAEVDGNTFALLLRSGWPVRTLCHVMVERIAGAVNNEDDDTYPEFNRYVEALAGAQSRRALDVVTRDGETMLREATPKVDIPGEVPGPTEEEHLLPLSQVQLRSFLDIMFFLGKNTRVPPEQAAQVKEAKQNDWIVIRSSADMPDDALVAVKYQGYYFSIANTDIRSKDTFALIKLLFQIQAGDIKTMQPILTLPVAQP